MDLKKKVTDEENLSISCLLYKKYFTAGNFFLVRICGLIEILKIHVMIARTAQ